MAATISKRWLINFGLIFMIICLSYIGNKYNVQPGYKTDSKITTLKADDVTRILVQTADQRIQYEKTTLGWDMVHPLATLANPIKVERLLGITNISTDSRLPGVEADLKQFGLDSPRALLRLNDTDFFFGLTNNIGNRRYVKIHSTIFLIPDLQFPLMNSPYHDYLDHRLLPISSNLRRLQLPGLDLTQSENGAWHDASKQTNPDQANRLVEQWNKLEARKVKPYDKNLNARNKIKLTLTDDRQISFYLLSISPELILARPDLGLQYHFSESDYYNLMAIADDKQTTD